MPVNSAVADEQWRRYEYCRDQGHLDFVRKADKCDNFLIGNQWEIADLERLRAERRPAMTINKIISTISTILGEQIYNRTEVLFRPKNGAPAEVADALNKVWMQISQNNQLDWTRSDVFCDGMVRSRGYFDVRLDFTDSMQGEVRISLQNSKNVVVDPDAEEYDPDSWSDCFTSKWLTPDDIAINYSEADAEYLKHHQDTVYGADSTERVRDRFAGTGIHGYTSEDQNISQQRNIRVLERQFRKLDKQEHFVDLQTGDMRPIPRDWDRNRIALVLEKSGGQLSTMKKLVKRVRWRVTAGNVLLHDDWSPYKHFTIVPFFPLFRYGKTVGAVENLLGPQEILNKVSSQELHIVNTTANSGWVVEQESLLNMTVGELEQKGAQTGLVIEYRKGAQPPAKIAPNQTPTGLDRITYKAEDSIKTISGVSDSMQGFDREDVAAKAIAYKQQRGSVSMAKPQDNLQRTDYLLARNVLDIVQEYYTEPRIIDIIHNDVTREAESIEVNKPDPVTGEILNDLTLGEYSIVVTSSPARASLEDSQFEQARALKELGVPIPDSVLIENSRLQNRADIIKQMEGDKESPEAQAAAQRQQRAEEAEVSKLEGEAQKAHAEAATKAQEAQGGDQSEQMKIMAEIQAMREEAQLKREEMEMKLQVEQQKLALKVEEMQQKLALQQQEHAQNLAHKEQAAQQDAQLKEEQAAAQRAQQLRQEAQGSSEPSQQE